MNLFSSKTFTIALVALCLTISLSAVKAQDFTEVIHAHRENYKANFIKETRSPLKEDDFKNLHFFEPNESFNVLARVKVLKNQKTFVMPTFDGTGKEFKKHLVLTFKVNNQTFTLIAYKNISLMNNPVYKDYLFVPFTDETNGKDTYAGGRYIDLKGTDVINKQIWIDFNKAYNPYCAYSDGYRCPIPPAENNLETLISAGEKKYSGLRKKSN